MCKVTEANKAKLKSLIEQTKEEIEQEEENLKELQESKEELQELIDGTECVLDNMDKCNFGGEVIYTSMDLNHSGYQERMDYYDEYIEKVENMILLLKDELQEMEQRLSEIPDNCGMCSECTGGDSGFYISGSGSGSDSLIKAI